jgi:hypothetical protein
MLADTLLHTFAALPGVTLACFDRRVLLNIWSVTPAGEAVTQLSSSLAEMPSPFCMLTVALSPLTRGHTLDLRLLASLVHDGREQGIRAAATVIVPRGFVGASMRAGLASAELTVRATHPRQTFDDFEDAAAFLASHDAALDAASLVAATTELCEAHRASASEP